MAVPQLGLRHWPVRTLLPWEHKLGPFSERNKLSLSLKLGQMSTLENTLSFKISGNNCALRLLQGRNLAKF